MIHQSEDWEGLAVQAGYDVGRLALIIGRSKRHLQRIIRKQFGCSPQEWLDQERLTRAPALLWSGMPVWAVARDLGFKQVPHFCRRFKGLHKLTPSQCARRKGKRFKKRR